MTFLRTDDAAVALSQAFKTGVAIALIKTFFDLAVTVDTLNLAAESPAAAVGQGSHLLALHAHLAALCIAQCLPTVSSSFAQRLLLQHPASQTPILSNSEAFPVELSPLAPAFAFFSI